MITKPWHQFIFGVLVDTESLGLKIRASKMSLVPQFAHFLFWEFTSQTGAGESGCQECVCVCHKPCVGD
mgnify:CR=1 FL=1